MFEIWNQMTDHFTVFQSGGGVNVYLMTILLVQENKSGGHFLFSYLAHSFLGGHTVTFEIQSFFSRVETVGRNSR